MRWPGRDGLAATADASKYRRGRRWPEWRASPLEQYGARRAPPPRSEVSVQVHKRAQRLANIGTRRVSRHEIAPVRDVVDVDVDTPRTRFIAKRRVCNHIRRNRIDVGNVAIALTHVIHACSNVKPRNSPNRKIVSCPEVGHVGGRALRMVAH